MTRAQGPAGVPLYEWPTSGQSTDDARFLGARGANISSEVDGRSQAYLSVQGFGIALSPIRQWTAAQLGVFSGRSFEIVEAWIISPSDFVRTPLFRSSEHT